MCSVAMKIKMWQTCPQSDYQAQNEANMPIVWQSNSKRGKHVWQTNSTVKSMANIGKPVTN